MGWMLPMRSWTLRHWIWFACFVILFAAAACFFAYTTVQRPLWNQESRAVRAALRETPMEHAERTALSHGERAFVIVYGLDEEEKSLIAWVGEEGVEHFAYPEEATSEEEIAERWRAAHPEARLIRIVPGMLRGEYVWEVYYDQKEEPKGSRKYYDYYRFEDGDLLTTYTLTLR
jgi:uncharacterized protein YpmB